MGNCIKPVDPLAAQIPRGSGIDATAVKESGLPIIFLLGGPGAGKGTQLPKVAKKYGFLGLNCGDILRGEVQKRSEKGFILARMMSEGRLVPADVLLELIKAEMVHSLEETKGFVLSGFPREKEQGKLFDKHVRPPDLIIYLRVRNALLIERVAARIVTTTERPYAFRYEEIEEHVKEFEKRNKLILKYYKKLITEIDGEEEIPVVYEDICTLVDQLLEKLEKRQPSQPTTSQQEEYEKV